MSYGGRNVAVGNPMPWAWPGAEEDCACAVGVQGGGWKQPGSAQGSREPGATPLLAVPPPPQSPSAKPFPGAGVGLQLLLLSLPSLQGAVLNGTSRGPTWVHFALQVAPPWGAVSPHHCPF